MWLFAVHNTPDFSLYLRVGALCAASEDHLFLLCLPSVVQLGWRQGQVRDRGGTLPTVQAAARQVLCQASRHARQVVHHGAARGAGVPPCLAGRVRGGGGIHLQRGPYPSRVQRVPQIHQSLLHPPQFSQDIPHLRHPLGICGGALFVPLHLLMPHAELQGQRSLIAPQASQGDGSLSISGGGWGCTPCFLLQSTLGSGSVGSRSCCSFRLEHSRAERSTAALRLGQQRRHFTRLVLEAGVCLVL